MTRKNSPFLKIKDEEIQWLQVSFQWFILLNFKNIINSLVCLIISNFQTVSLIARFRIKKKQKVLSLEQTVSDLSSRAKDLEREAINLRRENTWLKEIIIMKGRQNLAAAASWAPEEGSSSTTESNEASAGAKEDQC